MHELTFIDLVTELDESVKLFFELGLQGLVPELIWDKLSHSLVCEEHSKLAELLQIVLLDVTIGESVQAITEITVVLNLSYVNLLAKTPA